MAAGLLDVGVLFLTLAVAGAAGMRLGVSVVPVYLVGGILVGPHGLGRLAIGRGVAVSPDATVGTLAEVGIVLLLFFLGLEFSLDRLLAARDRIVRAGAIDAVVNFPLGLLVGFALGWTVLEAVLLAGVVYISSSAIITKSLIDSGWIADPEAEPVLGVLVFEDLVVAAYLAVVTSLVAGGDDPTATAGRVGIALGVLGAIALAARFGAPLLERWLRVAGSEQFVLRVLGLAVPVAGFALTVGASEAVAAFFVGMGVAETDHVDRAERLMTPLRDAFAAVFFVYVGLGTDPQVLVEYAVPLAAVLAVGIPGKLVSGYRGGRAFGLSARRSTRAGTALVARGEFSLIIATVAATGTGAVMTEVIPAVAVGYVLVSSVAGAVLMDSADWLSARLPLAGG